MKKTLFILPVVALGLALGACGDKAAKENKEAEKAGEKAAEKANDAAKAKVDQKAAEAKAKIESNGAPVPATPKPAAP